jgi:hypothetical protein
MVASNKLKRTFSLLSLLLACMCVLSRVNTSDS